MKICMVLLFISSWLVAFKVGDTLPQTLQEKLHLANNKVTIIDFFASWCPSCQKELPALEALHQKEKSIVLIGIDIDKDIHKAISFQKSLHLSFPIFNDTNHTLAEAFAPIAMPALYYIKKGKVHKILIGAKADIVQEINKDIQALQP